MSSIAGKNSPCVITRLEGGLGNQLFMYAAARRLAYVNGVPLKLETLSGFEADLRYKRVLMLDHFNIDFSEASSSEAYLDSDRRKYYVRKINRALPFSMRTFIEERKSFDPRILNIRIKRPIFLQGYWQDERYFEDIADLLRSEVVVPSLGNTSPKAGLNWKNVIGVHFRRVDYGHLLPIDYYRIAVQQAAALKENPTFMAIGDDLDFIRNHASALFPANANIIIPDTPSDQLADFHNLTQCGSLVIANSSFSWWAAWLNNQPDKQIWAPANWGYMAKSSRHWNLI
ncbi:MAG: alpha-1,2-fucosyltransferase [Pontiella sp.]